MKQLNPKPRCPELSPLSPEFVTLSPRRKKLLGNNPRPFQFCAHRHKSNPRVRGQLSGWASLMRTLLRWPGPRDGSLAQDLRNTMLTSGLALRKKKKVSLTTNLHLRKTEIWQELPSVVWIKWVNVCFDSTWQTELAELLTGHIWSKFL